MTENQVITETRQGIKADGDRPETHQSKRSQASVRQVQVVAFPGDIHMWQRAFWTLINETCMHGFKYDRALQLPDDMFVEEMGKNGQGDREVREVAEEDALEGILDSPEIANRRARLKEQMRTLSAQSAHGTRAYHVRSNSLHAHANTLALVAARRLFGLSNKFFCCNICRLAGEGGRPCI